MAPDRRRHVLSNPNLTTELLTPMRSDPDALVRAAVASHPACPAEWQHAFIEDADSAVRNAVAANPNLDPPLAKHFARSNEPALREAIAGNSAAARPYRAELLADAVPAVRAMFTRHDWLTTDEWRRLVLDPDQTVRNAAAYARALPGDLLSAMIFGGEIPPEHYPVFVNSPRLPVAAAEWLAQNAPIPVRKTLAHSSHAPTSARCILARDPEVEVRRSLAWNKTTPPEALEILVEDADDFVRLRVAESPRASAEVLMKLAKSEKPTGYMQGEMRKRVAESPKLNAAQVRELFAAELVIQESVSRSSWRHSANSSDAVSDAILATLIARPELPMDAIEPLLDHPKDVVQLALWRRADLPAEWRKKQRTTVISRAVRSASLFSRLCALEDAECSTEALARAALEGRWLERFAVTQNASTPPTLLEELTRDANVIVRAAAQERVQRSSS
jgi:hypothetical protein